MKQDESQDYLKPSNVAPPNGLCLGEVDAVGWVGRDGGRDKISHNNQPRNHQHTGVGMGGTIKLAVVRRGRKT